MLTQAKIMLILQIGDFANWEVLPTMGIGPNTQIHMGIRPKGITQR